MMDDKEREIRERRETPIMDGDARPDEGDRAERFLAEKEKAKHKATKERAADTNSLEDYKDAK